jgi:hypothetical protein
LTGNRLRLDDLIASLFQMANDLVR